MEYIENDVEYDDLMEKLPVKVARLIGYCGSGYIKGVCKNGHKFWGQIYCHKEYCPTCGVSGSLAHRRKIGRAWDKLRGWDDFGYMVFSIPRGGHEVLLRKEVIGKLYDGVKKILSGVGFEGGFNKIHFFGDKKETYYDLFLHINAIVGPGRWLNEDDLQSIKDKWSLVVAGLMGSVAVNAVVEYKYYERGRLGDDRFNKIFRHKIKYIMRPTIGFDRFTGLGDDVRDKLIELLECDDEGKGRLNLVRWWGLMTGKKGAEYMKLLNELVPKPDYEGDVCPECSERIDWDYASYGDVPAIKCRVLVSPGVYTLNVKCRGCPELIQGLWCKGDGCKKDIGQGVDKGLLVKAG